jgi:hypothetical protein
MWTVSMPQKSSWDKLQGERFRDRMGTLGGDGLCVIGVTTLIASWLCLERELLSVISSDATGAWEQLRLDWMMRRGMGVG